MDLQRSIAWLLLVVYGLPAACGPYWHHHSHESSCTSAVVLTESGASHADCPSCANLLRKQKQSKLTPVLTGGAGQCTDDGCSVCRFYASAVQLNQTRDWQAHKILVGSVAILHVLAARGPILSAWARGPPADFVSA